MPICHGEAVGANVGRRLSLTRSSSQTSDGSPVCSLDPREVKSGLRGRQDLHEPFLPDIQPGDRVLLEFTSYGTYTYISFSHLMVLSGLTSTTVVSHNARQCKQSLIKNKRKSKDQPHSNPPDPYQDQNFLPRTIVISLRVAHCRSIMCTVCLHLLEILCIVCVGLPPGHHPQACANIHAYMYVCMCARAANGLFVIYRGWGMEWGGDRTNFLHRQGSLLACPRSTQGRKKRQKVLTWSGLA